MILYNYDVLAYKYQDGAEILNEIYKIMIKLLCIKKGATLPNNFIYFASAGFVGGRHRTD